VLLPSERGGSHRLASILDECNLDQNSSNNDAQEEEIVEETMENVVFFLSKLSWVNLIEDLHEYEGVEDYSVVLGLLCWEDLLSTID